MHLARRELLEARGPFAALQLGQMRRNEFFASCKVLGVTHPEILDYQDAQLEHVDFSLAAGRLVEKIRSFLAQSLDASKSGDWARAQNLAQKARLLSTELINSF